MKNNPITYAQLKAQVQAEQASLLVDATSNLGVDKDIPCPHVALFNALPFEDFSSSRAWVNKLDREIECLRIYMTQALWAEGFMDCAHGFVNDWKAICDSIEMCRETPRYQVRRSKIVQCYQFIKPYFSQEELALIDQYEKSKAGYMVRLCILMYVIGQIHGELFSMDELCFTNYPDDEGGDQLQFLDMEAQFAHKRQQHYVQRKAALEKALRKAVKP